MTRYFNAKLYRDTLKQLRTIMITLAALCLTATFALVIIIRTSGMQTVAVTDIAPLLFGYVYIAPVLFITAAFSHLFDRSASDLFHSLPVSRLSMCLTLFAGVITAMTATITLNIAAGWALCGLLGVPLATFQIPSAFICLALVSLLVSSCMLIGVSCAGTRFSAFAVAMLILFLPRLVYTICAGWTQSAAWILNITNSGGILDWRLNLAVALATETSGASGGSGLFGSAPAMAYTLALSLIYLAAGVYLFVKRASETAEKPAPSPLMQHIYRCAVTFPLLLVTYLCVVYGNNGSFFGNSGALIVTLVTLTLVVYLLYEIITVKKFRSLLGAIKVLPVAVAVCAVLSAGMNWYARSEMNNLPGFDDIKSVRFTDDSILPDYNVLLQSEAVFADADTLRLVADSLAYSKDAYATQDLYFRAGARRTPIEVTLATGAVKSYNMMIKSSDFQMLDSLLMKNETYAKAANAMPQDNEIYSVQIYPQIFTESESLQLWDSFRREAQLRGGAAAFMGNYDYYAKTYSNGLTQNDYVHLDININVSGMRNGKSFISSYYITSLVPETAVLACETANRSGGAALKDINNKIKTNAEIQFFSLDIRLYNINMNGGKYEGDYISLQYGDSKTGEADAGNELKRTRIAEVMDILAAADYNSVDLTKPLVVLSAYLQGGGPSDENRDIGFMCFNTGDADMARLYNLLYGAP